MYKKTFAVESKQVLGQQQRPPHLVLESVKDTTTHIHLSLNPRITHHELQTLQEKVRQGQKQRRCTSATKLLLSDPSVHVVRPFSCAPRRSHPYGGETVPCSIPTAATFLLWPFLLPFRARFMGHRHYIEERETPSWPTHCTKAVSTTLNKKLISRQEQSHWNPEPLQLRPKRKVCVVGLLHK